MKHFNKTLALALVSWGIMAGNASALITIDTVLVGDPGNANDTTGYGGVGYMYSIGTYEVTLNQYCSFLNSVAKADTYSLYNVNMVGDANIWGIARAGASGSYAYSAVGSGARPVTYVSWFDAARFVNWLYNGQPTGAENASTTEQGAYALNGAMSGIFTRSATGYGLPSENEWYKAAYYQPTAKGGPASGYWPYATASSSLPNSRNGSAGDPNSANFLYNDNIANGYNTGYAVSQSPIYSTTQNYLTDAGAFSLAKSYYGTFDQDGNVMEWNDAVIGGTSRGLRGGDWNDGPISLQASSRGSSGPAGESSVVGFRIVIIPEPSVIGCMALGLAMLVWKRKCIL